MNGQAQKPVLTGLSSLKPDQKNARRRTERSSALIERSLSQYGAARSIVIDEDGRVLAGNGTLEAAAAIGIERVLVVPTDGSTLVAVQRTDLSETQKTELAISDNRTSDLSEFDGAQLAVLLEADPALDLSPFWTADEFKFLVEGIDGPGEPEATGKAHALKLSFSSQGALDAFLRSCQRLQQAHAEIEALEDRLQHALDGYLASIER